MEEVMVLAVWVFGVFFLIFALVGWWRFSNGLYRLSEAIERSAAMFASPPAPRVSAKPKTPATPFTEAMDVTKASDRSRVRRAS
jgi:hypothetical protein